MSEQGYAIKLPPRLWVDYNNAYKASDGTPCFCTWPSKDDPRDLKAGDHFIGDNFGDGVPDQWITIYDVAVDPEVWGEEQEGLILYLWRGGDMTDWLRVEGNTFLGKGGPDEVADA